MDLPRYVLMETQIQFNGYFCNKIPGNENRYHNCLTGNT